MLGNAAAELASAIAGAVVTHDPLHVDAALGEALERVLEKRDSVSTGLCGAQLRNGVAGVIVDG